MRLARGEDARDVACPEIASRHLAAVGQCDERSQRAAKDDAGFRRFIPTKSQGSGRVLDPLPDRDYGHDQPIRQPAQEASAARFPKPFQLRGQGLGIVGGFVQIS